MIRSRSTPVAARNLKTLPTRFNAVIHRVYTFSFKDISVCSCNEKNLTSSRFARRLNFVQLFGYHGVRKLLPSPSLCFINRGLKLKPRCILNTFWYFFRAFPTPNILPFCFRILTFTSQPPMDFPFTNFNGRVLRCGEKLLSPNSKPSSYFTSSAKSMPRR